jgi:hypothetical protein
MHLSKVLVVVQITTFHPSVRELGFLLFDRGAGILLQMGVVGSTGLCAPLEIRPLGTTCRVVGHCYSPLRGKLAFPLIDGGMGGSPTCG